nr:MAG TPA: hypothetical protein [Caudoviricetes sp.]
MKNKTLNPEEHGPGIRPAYFRRISANIFFGFFRFPECILKLRFMLVF